MRKDSKVNATKAVEGIQQYHAGSCGGGNYAQQGYTRSLFYASDRPIETERGEIVKRDANGAVVSRKPVKGYGLEIELKIPSITNDNTAAVFMRYALLERNFHKDLFKIQHDGSLGAGCECITQPMSREYIRNNYAAFKSMFKGLREVHGTAADESCGMHTNISYACFGNEDAVRKFYYIINRHYSMMRVLLKRTGNTYYCGAENLSLAAAKNVNFNTWADTPGRGYTHRYCINLEHMAESEGSARRVELRLVGGQEGYVQFRNTMETIFHLVDRCKTISWSDCDDLKAIFDGCNTYVAKRLEDLPAGASWIHQITVKPADYELR